MNLGTLGQWGSNSQKYGQSDTVYSPYNLGDKYGKQQGMKFKMDPRCKSTFGRRKRWAFPGNKKQVQYYRFNENINICEAVYSSRPSSSIGFGSISECEQRCKNMCKFFII